MVKREINNEEYEKALADPNNIRVLNAAGVRYSGYLSQEDRDECALKALWRTMQYHQGGRGLKFTSNLHRFMTWECRLELRKLKRLKRQVRTVTLFEETTEPIRESVRASTFDEDLEHVKVRMSLLDVKQRKLVEQYYLDDMSMEEIAAANGTSKEFTRLRIHEAVSRLKYLCMKGL